jgi:hypothetical protein
MRKSTGFSSIKRRTPNDHSKPRVTSGYIYRSRRTIGFAH